ATAEARLHSGLDNPEPLAWQRPQGSELPGSQAPCTRRLSFPEIRFGNSTQKDQLAAAICCCQIQRRNGTTQVKAPLAATIIHGKGSNLAACPPSCSNYQ